LLRKLPVKDPDRLVMLYQQGAHNGSNMGTRMHSYPVYQDLQQRAEPLAEVICRRLAPASVSIDNQTERISAEVVSGNYFTMRGDDRRARWVQVFARLKPGYTVETAAAPLQGLFTQVRQYEITLPAAKDWSGYSRDQFLKGKMLVTNAASGFSPLRNDFSTGL